jgi:hypothetical protein
VSPSINKHQIADEQDISVDIGGEPWRMTVNGMGFEAKLASGYR